LPHALQLLLSLSRFAQYQLPASGDPPASGLQSVWVAWQARTHTPPAQLCPVGQTLPQALQLWVSVWRSAQYGPVGGALLDWLELELDSLLDALSALDSLPEPDGLDTDDSDDSDDSDEDDVAPASGGTQRTWGAGQDGTHAAATHACPLGQARPQPLQLALSDWKLAQYAEPPSGVHGASGSGHTSVLQMPSPHVWPGAHAWPQLLQFWPSMLRSAQ
jgi:hypothetical protein